MSRGFLCALGGVGLTLLAWYGPWEWPAWPAFAAIELAFGDGGFLELSYAQRAAVVTGLTALNVASWAVVLRVLVALTDRQRARDAGAHRA